MKVVALDFETSGVDSKVNAPVTLGVALMDGSDVLASKEWLFKPPTHYKTGAITRTYDVAALEISGVSWKRIKTEGLPHATVVQELRGWAKEFDASRLTVVAFSAPFDFSFYSDLLFLSGGYDTQRREFRMPSAPLLGPWQCARMLAADAIDLPKYNLDAVAAHFGLSRETGTHGALEDAILAGRVYHALTGNPS